MKQTITLDLPQGVSPFNHNTTRSKRAMLRELANVLKDVAQGRGGQGVIRPKVTAGNAGAYGTVIAAAVAAADTITINGQALTATKQNATGTVTCASVSVNDTVTINGVVFTAKATASYPDRQWSQAGADGADGDDLAACINACTHASIKGVVSATSDGAGVVTIRASLRGIAGNTIPLVSSNGTRLAVSAATLENGAAWANNQFDILAGDNINTARQIAEAINISTTAIVNKHVMASSRTVTVALSSVSAGDWVNIGGVKFTAVDAANSDPATFDVSGNDTADGAALAVAINAHPGTRERVFAVNASGTVTVFQLPVPFSKTIATIDTAATTDWTIQVLGKTFTAVATDTGMPGTFLNTGNAAADAQMLANAINDHPDLKGNVLATVSTSTVTVLGRDLENILVAKSGSGITLGGSSVGYSATVGIFAKATGHSGNAITLASSNGTRLAVSGARLTGGTSTEYNF